jgi:hypothetical protein
VELSRLGWIVLDPGPHIKKVVDRGALVVHALKLNAGGDVVRERARPNRPGRCRANLGPARPAFPVGSL